MKEEEGLIKKDTLGPSTTAKDGRSTVRAYINKYRTETGNNQAIYHQNVIKALSLERMESYGDCKTDPKLVLARYILNRALCESLYQSLQSCEVALRNSIHQYLVVQLKQENWFDSPYFELSPWAKEQVEGAKKKIRKTKRVTAGRIVAELHFGFWTSLFEAHYEQKTLFLPGGIKGVFPHMPKSLHKRKQIKSSLDKIRALRNRVFHYERIIHWEDLEDQHRLIHDTIGYINPELLYLSEYGDSFIKTRKDGLDPWLEHLDEHWKEISGEER
ncbi:Abi family protein [Spirochaeta cellobiosiphila]|uniref:Abi family protein n=1 Tax=Spirochaeta cellobiosiphila TaxID=504483 RepID=UPI0004289557|nr:Abi family protein [Spirochaeta cellobiosiphila]